MTVLQEGELRFTFGAEWQAEQFDKPGTSWPLCIRPVDFLAQRQAELVLVEVKDPSASTVPGRNRDAFVRKMKTKELSHDELTPKARTTFGFLHLMERDAQPMRYVVVIGTEALSIQPPLLMNLADRLRNRLAQEADDPWKRAYMADCAVVSIADVGKVLPGCTVERIPPRAI
jgi:hypothetical protein